jgi:hypothetical protein
MTNNQTPEVRPTLTVVQNAPFNAKEADLLRSRGTSDLNLQPLYVPYMYQGGFNLMVQGSQTLQQFLQGSDYAIGPTDDDHPFFFNLNLGLPDGLAGALWATLVLVGGVLSPVLLLRNPPKQPGRGGPQAPRGAIWLLSLYMALLGVAFMCVEIPVIQRFILVLGEPVLALSAVLCALLLGGGIGSMAGGALFATRERLLPVAPCAAAAGALAAWLLLPGVTDALLPLGIAGAVAAAVLVLAPLGLLLGMPFSLGLRAGARLLPGDTALLWALNALFSVVGSVGSALLAVLFGFGTVLLVATVCYLLAAAALLVVLRLDPAPAILSAAAPDALARPAVPLAS